MLTETDGPFQHLNFHDGWWKNMITEDTWLWLALLSRLCHSIDSCAHRQVSQSFIKCYLVCRFYADQWILGWVGSDIERGKRLRVRRAILCYLYGVMFQIIVTRKKKKKSHSQRSYVMSTSPSNTWQCTIVFEKQDIWWITSLISSGASTPSPWSVCVLLHNTATVTWGIFDFSPLPWASDLNRCFSSQTTHKPFLHW